SKISSKNSKTNRIKTSNNNRKISSRKIRRIKKISNSSNNSKTRISRIKRISSRHKTSSRKTNRGTTKTKKNNSKRTSLRRRTNRKRNSSTSPARVHPPRPAQKSSRTISLRHRRANSRPNNHQALAKEKTRSLRLHREKARRKTPPLLPRNRRKRN